MYMARLYDRTKDLALNMKQSASLTAWPLFSSRYACKALITGVLLLKQNSTVNGNVVIGKRVFITLVYFKFAQDN